MSSTSSANEALSKAQEAAFIQSGARDFIDKLQRYAISKLNAPKEMAIAGYAYQTYKTKSLSLPFNNKKVILTTNAVTLEWPI
jgi:hypothetical protein